MFHDFSRLSAMDLNVILCISIAVSVLALALTVRMVVATRKTHERRVLVGLVLDMLEKGIAPEEITAVLRAMGMHRLDARFCGARRRLFRRYAKRRVAAQDVATRAAEPVETFSDSDSRDDSRELLSV